MAKFAIGMASPFHDIFDKIRSVMRNLVIVNVGNSLRTRISIVVLTLIAWVTIVTSAQMVSYDLQSRRGIVGSRFLFTISSREPRLNCI